MTEGERREGVKGEQRDNRDEEMDKGRNWDRQEARKKWIDGRESDRQTNRQTDR